MSRADAEGAASARRPRRLQKPTGRCRVPGRHRPSAPGAARDGPSRQAPRPPRRRAGRIADPARGARGIRQDHAAESVGRAGRRPVRLGDDRPGRQRPESPGPAHRSRAAGRPAAGRTRRWASRLAVTAGPRLDPARLSDGCRGAASPGPVPSCSSSTTCTRSGRRRPSRWCARCSTRAGRRSGWSRPDAAAPTSSWRTSSLPVAAWRSVRPTSPSPRRRRARSSSPCARR